MSENVENKPYNLQIRQKKVRKYRLVGTELS